MLIHHGCVTIQSLTSQLFINQLFMPSIKTPSVNGKSDKNRFAESLGFMLVKNALIFEKLADIRLAPLDITSSQMRVLMMIGYAGFTMASTIAKKLGSNAGGVVRSLDKLEAKGWIERIRSEKDRREVHLRLTKEGEVLIDKIPDYLKEPLNRALKGISQEEHQQLMRLLERVAENNIEQLHEHEKTSN